MSLQRIACPTLLQKRVMDLVDRGVVGSELEAAQDELQAEDDNWLHSDRSCGGECLVHFKPKERNCEGA